MKKDNPNSQTVYRDRRKLGCKILFTYLGVGSLIWIIRGFIIINSNITGAERFLNLWCHVFGGISLLFISTIILLYILAKFNM